VRGSSREANNSRFFNGFVWVAHTANMGFRWKIGNGRKVKFWEDNWLGTLDWLSNFRTFI
jgi:hypothetical protein